MKNFEWRYLCNGSSDLLSRRIRKLGDESTIRADLLKGKGNVCLHGHLILDDLYTVQIYDIYVDGLYTISVKNLTMKSHDFVRRYLFTAR